MFLFVGKYRENESCVCRGACFWRGSLSSRLLFWVCCVFSRKSDGEGGEGGVKHRSLVMWNSYCLCGCLEYFLFFVVFLLHRLALCYLPRLLWLVQRKSSSGVWRGKTDERSVAPRGVVPGWCTVSSSG